MKNGLISFFGTLACLALVGLTVKLHHIKERQERIMEMQKEIKRMENFKKVYESYRL